MFENNISPFALCIQGIISAERKLHSIKQISNTQDSIVTTTKTSNSNEIILKITNLLEWSYNFVARTCWSLKKLVKPFAAITSSTTHWANEDHSTTTNIIVSSVLVAAKICDSHIMGLHVAPSRKRLQQARRAAKPSLVEEVARKTRLKGEQHRTKANKQTKERKTRKISSWAL
jgi:hypothetical protein